MPDTVAGLLIHIGGWPKQAIGDVRERVQGGERTSEGLLCCLVCFEAFSIVKMEDAGVGGTFAAFGIFGAYMILWRPQR